jgi:hypothetical protein
MAASLALAWAVALGAAAPAPAAAAAATPAGPVLEVLLPVTPAQARELLDLARSHDIVIHEGREVAVVLGQMLAGMPGALAHDVMNAIPRHLALARGVAVDLGRLPRALTSRDAPLAGETLKALHRSSTLSSVLTAVQRLTGPDHRSVRLAVVLAARAHGIPAADADLDSLRLALDREAADLRPLAEQVLVRLLQRYGREALLVFVGS